MTKDKALYAFFSTAVRERKVIDGSIRLTGKFLDTYPANAVLNENGELDVTLPYQTYTPVFDAWGGEPASLTVNIWDRTESESAVNDMAQDLSNAIGMGGKIIPCDEGYIWLKRGSPWCQNLADEVDPAIKRRYINVTAEYLTSN